MGCSKNNMHKEKVKEYKKKQPCARTVLMSENLSTRAPGVSVVMLLLSLVFLQLWLFCIVQSLQ